MKIKADYANAPQWKETTIKSSLPKELKCLDEIAHNMWWAWNYEGRDLFKSLDPELYEKVNANPVLLLERLSYDRKEAIVKDKETMAKVKKVYKMFRDYMDVKPNAKRPSVAYFCMEYGINQVVKIYSGGLGMLAGDYLKEASDSNVDMCAVGFLYRYGYFKQSLSMDGQQIANHDAQNFNSLPLERVLDENGNPVVVDVPYTNYQVHAYVWQMNVGRIKLYLLDTDNDMNSEFDRPITHSLYGGDWENRLKQEILLGIGGMLATRLSSWFALLLSILFTLQCQLVTTTSTRLSSVSTWVAIHSVLVSLGMSSSVWVVRTQTIITSVSVSLHSLAILVRRLMV